MPDNRCEENCETIHPDGSQCSGQCIHDVGHDGRHWCASDGTDGS